MTIFFTKDSMKILTVMTVGAGEGYMWTQLKRPRVVDLITYEIKYSHGP